ncbi:MAG: hypothetical protein J6X86_07310 [Bacteroidales bacterium]|nr:hypothetical protein [Bacteroidales bacterium]
MIGLYIVLSFVFLWFLGGMVSALTNKIACYFIQKPGIKEQLEKRTNEIIKNVDKEISQLKTINSDLDDLTKQLRNKEKTTFITTSLFTIKQISIFKSYLNEKEYQGKRITVFNDYRNDWLNNIWKR